MVPSASLTPNQDEAQAPFVALDPAGRRDGDGTGRRGLSGRHRRTGNRREVPARPLLHGHGFGA